MKTKDLLHYFVFILVLGWTGVSEVQAQFIKQEVKNKYAGSEKKLMFDTGKYRKKVAADGSLTYYKKIVPLLKQDGETYTITPDLQYDPEKFIFNMATIYSRAQKQFVASFINDEGEVTAVNLPAGTYDLVVSFDSNEDNPITYFVIKEEINVRNDSTWSFSPSEAKNHVTTEIYTEKGEVLKAGGDNTGQATVECSVYLHGTSVGSFSTWSFVDFYISNVKNVRIAETVGVNRRQGMIWGEYYINKLQHTGEITEDLVLRNDPTDYKVHTEYFRRGPEADLVVQVERSNIELETWIMADAEGMFHSTSSFVTTSDSVSMEKDYFETHPIHLYLNNPLQDLSEENPCNILASTAIVETMDTIECMEFDGELYYNTKGRKIVSPRMVAGRNEEIVYINAGIGDFSDLATGKEIYNFVADPDNPILLNSTCQVQLFPYSSYINDVTYEKYQCLDPVYVGNYGEKHETLYQAEVIYNGNNVFVGDTLSAFLERWEKEEQHKGKFEITTVNTNIFVNDVLGKNTTKVVYDNTREDGEFPRLQMVQFRNKEDKVTNRVDQISDIKILFSVGDFDYDGFQFAYKGADNVAISYSLQGTDQWKKLNYKKLQSESGAFGDTYQSSLEEERNENSNQWYDLKIESSDREGNSQTQIFSPAFFVLHPSSVGNVVGEFPAIFIKGNTVYTSANCEGIEIYNLSGQKMRSVNDAARTYRIDGLASGMYLVKVYMEGKVYTEKAVLE